MNNILYNNLPKNILLNNIFPHLQFKDILILGRITKNHNKALIRDFKNFWDRNITANEIESNPLLPLFQIIDAFNQCVALKLLYKENENLFNNDRIQYYTNPWAPLKAPLNIDINVNHLLIEVERIDTKNLIRQTLVGLKQLEIDINNAKKSISSLYYKSLLLGMF